MENNIDYTMRRKSMPIGTSDYKKLIDKGAYYIDKTMLVKTIIDDASEVTLFTRPRRFGKTLNLSMLRYYFEITDDDKSYLFKDKFIWKQGERYIREQAKYPVIYLTFKDVKENSYSLMLKKIKNTIDFMIDSFESDIMNAPLGIMEKEYYNRILHGEATETDYTDILKFLSSVLSKCYKKPVIILIDEYDTPLNSAHVNGYEHEAVTFMRGLLSGAFKDNSYLKKGMITGINRIAKENIFSGLNNLTVDTVFDTEYSTCFGITEAELKEMLTWCGLELTADIKKWYDGYNIGGYEIYNPWSILNYIRYGDLKPYWVNTASNDLIVECVQKGDGFFKKHVGRLFNGETIRVPIEKEMTYDRLNIAGNIWGLFVNAGYLTLADYETNYTSYNIKIPNYEIMDEFDKIIAKSANSEFTTMVGMFEALMSQDYELFINMYRTIVKQVMSFYDTKENAYHMFMLGMCVSLKPAYIVKSNIETGSGRSDIICYPKSKEYLPIIMEFKSHQDECPEETLKELAENAIKQIKDNEYYIDFKDESYRETILIGIAHHKKQSEVVMERFTI